MGRSLVSRRLLRNLLNQREVARYPARPKFTPATGIAFAALLVALAGPAHAVAERIGDNSVGTRHLRNSAVTGPKLHKDSVSTCDLVVGSTIVDRTSAYGGVSGDEFGFGDSPMSLISMTTSSSGSRWVNLRCHSNLNTPVVKDTKIVAIATRA